MERPAISISWGVTNPLVSDKDSRFTTLVADSARISAALPREMKPNILLIGRNGQVGTELASLLPRLGEVAALNRQELDLTKPDDIRRTIRDIRPQ